MVFFVFSPGWRPGSGKHRHKFRHQNRPLNLIRAPEPPALDSAGSGQFWHHRASDLNTKFQNFQGILTMLVRDTNHTATCLQVSSQTCVYIFCIYMYVCLYLCVLVCEYARLRHGQSHFNVPSLGSQCMYIGNGHALAN